MNAWIKKPLFAKATISGSERPPRQNRDLRQGRNTGTMDKGIAENLLKE